MKRTTDEPEPGGRITKQEHLAKVFSEVQRELAGRIAAYSKKAYQVFRGVLGFGLLQRNTEVTLRTFRQECRSVSGYANDLVRERKAASELMARYQLLTTENAASSELTRAFADAEQLVSFADRQYDLDFPTFVSEVVTRAMNNILTAVNSRLDLSGFEAKIKQPEYENDKPEEDRIPFFLSYKPKTDWIFPLDKVLRCRTPRRHKSQNNVSTMDIETITYMADHGISMISSDGLGHDELDKAKASFVRWHGINPRSLEFVTTERGERVGFTCVLPMKPSAFDLYRSGRLSEWAINKEHVNSIEQLGGQRHLLIQSITLSDERGKRVYDHSDKDGLAWKYRSALFHTLVRQMARLLPNEQIPVLIADAPERNGKIDELLLETGFNKVMGGPDKRYIYWVDLSDPWLNPMVVSRRDRLLSLLRSYWEVGDTHADE